MVGECDTKGVGDVVELVNGDHGGVWVRESSCTWGCVHEPRSWAPVRRPRWDAHVLGLAVGLHVVWGCSFLLAMLGGEQPRGWVSAISYFTVALLIMWSLWRGKPCDMPTEEEW